ncbi:MAG TPA: hypothetical protein VGG19_12005 [Tepidisphaeraceae bacterium]
MSLVVLLVLLPAGRTHGATENVFVSLFNTGIIDEVRTDGSVSTFATVPGHPSGLAFDPYGDLFVATYAATSTIYEISPTGSVSTFVTGLHNLTHLAFDSAGNLYAADEEGYAIDKITPKGIATTFATLPVNDEPEGLAFDSSGNLYCATLDNGIEKISPSGNATFFSQPSQLEVGLAFDSMGNLYVANDGNAVNKITPTGTITQYATGFAQSSDLTFDAMGNLFVTNPPNPGRISEITSSGLVTDIADVGSVPYGIAIYVPEPSVTLSLIVGWLGCTGRSRGRI